MNELDQEVEKEVPVLAEGKLSASYGLEDPFMWLFWRSEKHGMERIRALAKSTALAKPWQAVSGKTSCAIAECDRLLPLLSADREVQKEVVLVRRRLTHILTGQRMLIFGVSLFFLFVGMQIWTVQSDTQIRDSFAHLPESVPSLPRQSHLDSLEKARTWYAKYLNAGVAHEASHWFVLSTDQARSRLKLMAQSEEQIRPFVHTGKQIDQLNELGSSAKSLGAIDQVIAALTKLRTEDSGAERWATVIADLERQLSQDRQDIAAKLWDDQYNELRLALREAKSPRNFDDLQTKTKALASIASVANRQTEHRLFELEIGQARLHVLVAAISTKAQQLISGLKAENGSEEDSLRRAETAAKQLQNEAPDEESRQIVASVINLVDSIRFTKASDNLTKRLEFLRVAIGNASSMEDLRTQEDRLAGIWNDLAPNTQNGFTAQFDELRSHLETQKKQINDDETISKTLLALTSDLQSSLKEKTVTKLQSAASNLLILREFASSKKFGTRINKEIQDFPDIAIQYLQFMLRADVKTFDFRGAENRIGQFCKDTKIRESIPQQLLEKVENEIAYREIQIPKEMFYYNQVVSTKTIPACVEYFNNVSRRENNVEKAVRAYQSYLEKTAKSLPLTLELTEIDWQKNTGTGYNVKLTVKVDDLAVVTCDTKTKVGSTTREGSHGTVSAMPEAALPIAITTVADPYTYGIAGSTDWTGKCTKSYTMKQLAKGQVFALSYDNAESGVYVNLKITDFPDEPLLLSYEQLTGR
jgi:alkylhydroperoxidase/carboxymuconolactone decarboxylase family protein YurZ